MLTDELEHLMHVADAADLLAVSKTFLYREISAKRISVIRIRGRIRIAPTDLTDYLERHRDRSFDSSKPNRKHF